MGDERILCVETDDGLKPIESTGIKKCLRCGVDITPENDSGWEKFVDGRTTQPICKDCDAKETDERNCAHVNCMNQPIFYIKVSPLNSGLSAFVCKEHIEDLLSNIFRLPEKIDFIKVFSIVDRKLDRKMGDEEKTSLKDWKPDEVEEIEELEEIYPEEINIKINKVGSVILSIGDVCIGQISKLVLEADADAVIGNVSKFHIEQFSIDVSEDGKEYVKVLHEFDGVSEFIFGQKRINLIEEQLERNREGTDDDN